MSVVWIAEDRLSRVNGSSSGPQTVEVSQVGLQDKLRLGNLDAKRDWGFAEEYVETMWLMLQQDRPDDYVISTGETHSVREFVATAFGLVDLDWRDFVEHDERYDRPAEVNLLLGDSTKAKTQLGWQPRVKFDGLVKLMVEADLELARREKKIFEATASIAP